MNLIIDSLVPLKKVVDVLTEIPPNMTALEMMATIRRAENILEKLQDQLVVEANADFQKLRENTKETSWRMADGHVVITAYTPRSSWVYPAALVKLHAELTAKQKDAQIKKTAKKITPKLDPAADKLFILHSAKSFARYQANATANQ